MSRRAELNKERNSRGAGQNEDKGQVPGKGQAPDKGQALDKRRYSRDTILRLGKYMLQYKWLLAAAVICTLGSNLFSLIGPKLTGLCISAIEFGQGAVDFETVFYYAAWMAGFYVISALMS